MPVAPGLPVHGARQFTCYHVCSTYVSYVDLFVAVPLLSGKKDATVSNNSPLGSGRIIAGVSKQDRTPRVMVIGFVFDHGTNVSCPPPPPCDHYSSSFVPHRLHLLNTTNQSLAWSRRQNHTVYQYSSSTHILGARGMIASLLYHTSSWHCSEYSYLRIWIALRSYVRV